LRKLVDTFNVPYRLEYAADNFLNCRTQQILFNVDNRVPSGHNTLLQLNQYLVVIYVLSAFSVATSTLQPGTASGRGVCLVLPAFRH
jgi:hypothetical protein